jgi:hypothetical protein
MPRLRWAREHEPQVRRIVDNANHFALRYASYPARIMYWKYVLLAYRSLIPGMDEYFAQSAATGSQMEVMLKDLAQKQGFASVSNRSSHAARRGQDDEFLDPDIQSQLEAVAALAGDDDAEAEEQQLGAAVLLGPGSDLEDALSSLAGSED